MSNLNIFLNLSISEKNLPTKNIADLKTIDKQLLSTVKKINLTAVDSQHYKKASF